MWTTLQSTDLSFKIYVEYQLQVTPEQNVPNPYPVKANQKSDRRVTHNVIVFHKAHGSCLQQELC